VIRSGDRQPPHKVIILQQYRANWPAIDATFEHLRRDPGDIPGHGG